jgi:hypothetical protein
MPARFRVPVPSLILNVRPIREMMSSLAVSNSLSSQGKSEGAVKVNVPAMVASYNQHCVERIVRFFQSPVPNTSVRFVGVSLVHFFSFGVFKTSKIFIVRSITADRRTVLSRLHLNLKFRIIFVDLCFWRNVQLSFEAGKWVNCLIVSIHLLINSCFLCANSDIRPRLGRMCRIHSSRA